VIKSQCADIELRFRQFFQSEKPLSRNKIWPLQNEALFYASCAFQKMRLSNADVIPPPLPALPCKEWLNVQADELFGTIQTRMLEAPEYVSNRHDVLPLLERMSAHGWVVFKEEICRKLSKFLPSQRHCYDQVFTGNVIVGVVKPLIKKEEWCLELLQKRLQTMALMRSLGWGL
jgi:hypothetical protein